MKSVVLSSHMDDSAPWSEWFLDIGAAPVYDERKKGTCRHSKPSHSRVTESIFSKIEYVDSVFSPLIAFKRSILFALRL